MGSYGPANTKQNTLREAGHASSPRDAAASHACSLALGRFLLGTVLDPYRPLLPLDGNGGLVALDLFEEPRTRHLANAWARDTSAVRAAHPI